MKHHLLTIGILVAAIVLYGAGMTIGSLAFFVAGIACELWFWGRIFRRRRSI